MRLQRISRLSVYYEVHMNEVAPSTAQLIHRAETAEQSLEMAVKQIERTLNDFEALMTLLLLISDDYSGMPTYTKLELLRKFLLHAKDKLETWDIPF